MNTIALNFKALPLAERIQLVEDIWDSIAEDTSSGLALSAPEVAELHRRMNEHRSNPASSIPWEQVRPALFRQPAQ